MDHVLNSTDLEADRELVVAHMNSFGHCDPSKVHTVSGQLPDTGGELAWGSASAVPGMQAVHVGRYRVEGLTDSKDLDGEDLAVDDLESWNTGEARRLSIGSC
jgi:hypothetical protein